jgi:redox-sensitive bicupin YhaK (pirin superfamily)
VSSLDPDPALGAGPATPVPDLLAGRTVAFGRHTSVRRYLPDRGRRTIGAWCFLDHFGPDEVGAGPGMRVPPHPHTGLQTVSWLFEGEILHTDSLGSRQSVRPGQLNLMTAGHGIAHAEQSVRPVRPGPPSRLHGLQLWVALPPVDRTVEPRFEHHPELPATTLDGGRVTVLLGGFPGLTDRSPATVHSAIVGAQVTLQAGARVELPTPPAFEHGVLVISGRAGVAGEPLEAGQLRYLEPGTDRLVLTATVPTRLMVLGGEPFADPLVMWWNFVGRSHEEIVRAREDWTAGRRFGTVAGFDGEPLPAPALPNVRLTARSRDGKAQP